MVLFLLKYTRATAIFIIIAFIFLVSLCKSCSQGKKTSRSLVRIEVKSVKNGNWDFRGSGVLFEKTKASTNGRTRSNVYSVATAAHVVKGENSIFRIITHNKASYEISESDISKAFDTDCVDIAKLSFVSRKNYEVPNVSASDVENEMPVFLNGWFSTNTERHTFRSGDVNKQLLKGNIVNTKLDFHDQEGCSRFRYTLEENPFSLNGMSGAPIFDQNFELVGLHTQTNSWNQPLGIPIKLVQNIN